MPTLRCFLLTLSTLWLLPQPALAGPGDNVDHDIKLEGANGYLVHFSAERFGTSTATITASRGPASVTYALLQGARIGGRRIVARFGEFGSLDVTFQPDRGRCGLRENTRGTYRGTIEFRGEDGYTEVSAKSAVGKAQTGYCGRREPSARSSQSRPFERFLAACRTRGGYIPRLLRLRRHQPQST